MAELIRRQLGHSYKRCWRNTARFTHTTAHAHERLSIGLCVCTCSKQQQQQRGSRTTNTNNVMCSVYMAIANRGNDGNIAFHFHGSFIPVCVSCSLCLSALPHVLSLCRSLSLPLFLTFSSMCCRFPPLRLGVSCRSQLVCSSSSSLSSPVCSAHMHSIFSMRCVGMAEPSRSPYRKRLESSSTITQRKKHSFLFRCVSYFYV